MKIGVFDSGIGGLPIAKKIKEKFPSDEVIFISDREHMPYGNKSPDLVVKFANKMIKKLENKGAEIIIAACGTVSSLISRLDHVVPLEGIIIPLCTEACAKTTNNRVGVIATVNTINSGSFAKCIKKINNNVEIYSYACPDLALLIENNEENDKILLSLSEPLKYFNESKIDTLILGCTHYSWISDLIKEKVPEIKLIYPEILVDFLQKQKILSN